LSLRASEYDAHFRWILADLGHRNEKIEEKKIFGFIELKNDIFPTSASRASFWASLKKFDFFAISKSS